MFSCFRHSTFLALLSSLRTFMFSSSYLQVFVFVLSRFRLRTFMFSSSSFQVFVFVLSSFRLRTFKFSPSYFHVFVFVLSCFCVLRLLKKKRRCPQRNAVHFFLFYCWLSCGNFIY